MSSKASVGHILKQLEERVAHHRERQAFHAGQEKLHREQAEHHAAGLETALARLEAFKAAAAAAGELLEHDRSAGPSPPEPNVDPGLDKKRRPLSSLVERVVEDREPDEVFGATLVTQEIQHRWGAKLRGKVDPRTVAATLRRLAVAGRLHQVRDGRAFHESLFSKTKAGAGG